MNEIPRQFPAVAQDLMSYVGRQVADQQIRLVVTLAEHLDGERLARAMRLTADVEPVIGARLVEQAGRPYWERRNDLDQALLCQLVESSDTEKELWRFICKPVDPLMDPQVQGRVFRSPDSEGDTLCIKMSHVAADAGGIKEYAYLLSSIYRKLATDANYYPKPNILGSRGQDQVFKQFESHALDNALRRLTAARPVLGLPKTGDDLSVQAFAVRRIEREQLDEMKAYGRAYQASVNDLLVAAFYCALFKVLDPPVDVPIPVQVQIDLRRYLPSGRAEGICNLSSAISPAISRKAETSFYETLRDSQMAMRSLEADNPGLGRALYMELAFEQRFADVQQTFRRMLSLEAAEGKCHPCFSNFGVIDQRELVFGDAKVLDAYIVSPVLFSPGFMLGASTFRRAITLTVGYPSNAVDGAIVGRILDSFLEELP